MVVIGVHSAKFQTEEDAASVREAMERHGVRHPVVVDRGRGIWASYAVKAWPTLVLVRPDGTIAAVAPGEAELEALDALVGRLLEEARASGTLAAERYAVERPPEAAPSVLRFPGKLIALPGGRLAVADSGHHRVVVVDGEGRLEAVAGSGEAGLVDGALFEARFERPQGLAFDPERACLYVADTGNHAIREVDLKTRAVRTLAGTGDLGRGMPRGVGPGRETALRSPWDLVVAGDFLLVAMAGLHQIWALDRRAGTIGAFAGSGREAIDDGSFAEASFAQPSGLALAGPRLFVADSETSAVRVLDLEGGSVRTLVGTGLFDFGDVDGRFAQARLQHPIGIAVGPHGLLVADSYNHKLKRVDPTTERVTTWFEAADGIALREPAGLAQLADGRVVVADTNQHRLVEIARDRKSARVVALGGASEA